MFAPTKLKIGGKLPYSHQDSLFFILRKKQKKHIVHYTNSQQGLTQTNANRLIKIH
jgi:hypothetical protein